MPHTLDRGRPFVLLAAAPTRRVAGVGDATRGVAAHVDSARISRSPVAPVTVISASAGFHETMAT